MKLDEEVSGLLNKWMPETTEIFGSMVKEALHEEQDLVILLFGPPGKGKSNLGYLLSIYATLVVNKVLKLNRTFDLKTQAAWLGRDYLTLFKEPGRKLATLLENGSMEQLRKLQLETRGMVYWLDEAKDLSVQDMLTVFNKTFSGILATCRGLQHIYILCLDSPTKLLPDIREARVNMAVYVFVGKGERIFEGKKRNVRLGATYGRKEWVNLIFEKNKEIRSYSLMPELFINKFPPHCAEHIPLFPDCPERQEYTLLKHGSMGRIIITDLEHWEEKEGIAGSVRWPCKCPKCGYEWYYGGISSSFITCNSCQRRPKLLNCVLERLEHEKIKRKRTPTDDDKSKSTI